MAKIVTGPNQKPPEHPFYGPYNHRGKDPWHEDAFPEEFKASLPNKGRRNSGWFLEDAWGNEIMFVPDGTEFPGDFTIIDESQISAVAILTTRNLELKS